MGDRESMINGKTLKTVISSATSKLESSSKKTREYLVSLVESGGFGKASSKGEYGGMGG